MNTQLLRNAFVILYAIIPATRAPQLRSFSVSVASIHSFAFFLQRVGEFSEGKGNDLPMKNQSLLPPLLIPAFFLVLFALTGAAHGDTITVQNINDSGGGSLRQAVRDAATLHPNNETTIEFSPAVFHQKIVLSRGPIEIQSKLIILGPGADLLTVSGTQQNRIFTVLSGVSLSLHSLTLSDGFDSGQNGGHGGAILNAGSLVVSRCAFVGNFVLGTSFGDGHGGAIENTKSVYVHLCTFNNNSAEGGGAIYNGPDGYCEISLSTFTKNSVSLSTGAGGGAILHRGKTLYIEQSTIADNTANGAGGGIYTDVPMGTIGLDNNIIALNHAPNSPDTYGAYKSDGYNLVGISDAGNGFTKSTDRSGTVTAPLDPKLVPLANNGGPVQTMALQPDSPAIDQGLGLFDEDERGFPSKIDYPGIPAISGGDNTDIGAFELAAPSTLLNISTRLRVLTNDKPLIGGFIITGSEPKKVIIRGMGPSLGANGVQGTLPDPVLELHQGSSILAVNDNWKETQQTEIEAATLAPGSELESAMTATLDPGSYTAILRGKNNTIGVGLIEVYDLDVYAHAELANISTRGFVDAGDNAMIGGFIVGGAEGANSPTRILIRGIGPSLQDFGIGNALLDPTLELHDDQGVVIQSNDNWKNSQQTEIAQSGLAPTRDAESAIAVTVSRGLYTVILRGKNGSTGVGVVEVYNLR